MRRRTIWIAAFGLGAIAALIAALIGVLGFFFILLVVPGLRAGTWLSAMSGALTGFGVSWLLLLGTQAGSGGTLSSSDVWLLVGLVPLALGLASGAVTIIVDRRSSTSGGIGRS
jgi:hypothetical protein